MPCSCAATSSRSNRSRSIALGPTAAFELGEERAQRVATAQLVGAERHDDRDRRGPELMDQIGEQVAGRAIGPVQVLDDAAAPAGRARAVRASRARLRTAGSRRAAGSTARSWSGGGELGDETTQLGRGRARIRHASWPRRPRARACATPRPSARRAVRPRRGRCTHHSARGWRRPSGSAISRTSRVLPTPASPPTTTALASPVAARIHRGSEAAQRLDATDERRTRNPGCQERHSFRPSARHATLRDVPAGLAAGRRIDDLERRAGRELRVARRAARCPAPACADDGAWRSPRTKCGGRRRVVGSGRVTGRAWRPPRTRCGVLSPACA